MAAKSKSPYGQPFSGKTAAATPGLGLLQALAGVGIILVAVIIFANAGVQEAIANFDHPAATMALAAWAGAEALLTGWWTSMTSSENRERNLFLWTGWVFLTIFLVVVLRWSTRSRA